jgi:acetylornithine deacetylase
MQLMAIDSTSGREADVIACAEQLLGARGWRTRRIPVTPGRDNLLAESGDAPLLAFSTHLDTVPPFIPPKLDGDRLTGRGACDAKGIAAAMICAAEALRDAGTPVALLFVIGEEVTHDGARAANKVPIGTRVLINGEPTESTLALGTKGALRFTLRTHGKAAHSAYPHLGRSATSALVHLLSEIEGLHFPCDELLGQPESVELPSDELLGETTINIGRLSGGVADNVIAPQAEARLMARLVGPESELKAIVKEWVAGRAEIEFGECVPAVRLGTLPGFATSVAAYATDVPNLPAWGTPYLFGPGSIHVAHTDHEFIAIAELRDAVGAYERLARSALGV